MQNNLIWNSLLSGSSPTTPKTVPSTPILALKKSNSPSMLSPPMKRTLIPSTPPKKINESLDSVPVYTSFEDSGYEMIEELGSGAFGSVWRAKKGKEFAIKKFNVKRQEGRDGFMRELAAQFFIEKHSKRFCENTAVCGTTAFIVKNPNQCSAFIIYPFVVAGDLARLIEKLQDQQLNKENQTQQNTSLSHLINLGVNFLKNVAEMHKNNIVHRDIKPENVLVLNNKKDQSVFIDFGSACFFDSSGTFQKQLNQLFDNVEAKIGKVDRNFSCSPIDTTLLYMDPELAEVDEIADKKLDFEYGKKADIFAAAVVLYELFLQKRAISLLTSKNPIALISWKPNTKLLLEKQSVNNTLGKTYNRLSMLIDNMLLKNESIDVYAEQLQTIAKLLEEENLK